LSESDWRHGDRSDAELTARARGQIWNDRCPMLNHHRNRIPGVVI
jgi:hypothetical protein